MSSRPSRASSPARSSPPSGPAQASTSPPSSDRSTTAAAALYRKGSTGRSGMGFATRVVLTVTFSVSPRPRATSASNVHGTWKGTEHGGERAAKLAASVEPELRGHDNGTGQRRAGHRDDRPGACLCRTSARRVRNDAGHPGHARDNVYRRRRHRAARRAEEYGGPVRDRAAARRPVTGRDPAPGAGRARGAVPSGNRHQLTWLQV